MFAPLHIDEELRDALARLLDGLPPRQAAAAVERLISGYRDSGAGAPVLRDSGDVAAYAAYRMPATFEAVRAALDALADRAPELDPATHLDVGGGTGAAVWAAAAVWGDGPDRNGQARARARATTVLDRSEPALALGRELAGGSGSAALRGTEWRQERIGAAPGLEAADLVTVSYVLNELPGDARHSLADAAAAAARRAVVIVEPGTPEGYRRIIEARGRLIGAGLRVLAPCPHSGACPVEPDTDWCHFAARVSRSSLHRRVKGGSLAYEDEKFSYVAAVRPGAGGGDTGGGTDGTPAAARIVRRPQIRKGQVLLDLCAGPDAGRGGLRRETVTKRRGPAYRAARDARWGDAWSETRDGGRDGGGD
ncbi:small ribosomal subunit Rsm22 family protein [Streptomyces sp. CNQ085]|uniref:small ribosomal subunit Rsm22 family protein n=1 Tax=Streptomyces sp. CNQ085 TaxID=2886944 RepID=UPI001F505EA7|nr:small ribosomal subunit Rsm22 family protein [Streptomyces sp. CNQ085]MCI0386180.1 small ribosomal subunit Rsm22 family protein [Streptomyces sp. CNQ085]